MQNALSAIESSTVHSKAQIRKQFSSFLSLHQNRILAIAANLLHSREDALDILQEVALKIYQNWQKLDHSQNIDGWLYRVTVNESYRWLNTKSKLPIDSKEHCLESLQTASPEQEGHLRTKQFQLFLAKALEQLSEQERIAFVLRDIEHLSGKEIAQIMDYQATTARGYYFSARKKLAQYIQKDAPEWMSIIRQGC